MSGEQAPAWVPDDEDAQRCATTDEWMHEVAWSRWLAAHDAEVRAGERRKALTEAADWLASMVTDDGPGNRNTGYGQAGHAIIARLRARAAEVAS